MAVESHQHLFLFILTILYPFEALILNCTDATSCAKKEFHCSDEICQLHCNARYACEYTHFECTMDYLHGECQINCAGRNGCEAMTVISFRDTNISCTGSDSCDHMDVKIYGVDSNDKISATLTSIGSHTDQFRLKCSGDGIHECFLDCKDNLEYYSCIQVQFDCYTPGTCRYKCENAYACCGCTMWDWDLFALYKPVNALHCYGGYDNCIKEDPGCFGDFSGSVTTECIVKVHETTVEPTTRPTSDPTHSGETKHPSIGITTPPTSADPTYILTNTAIVPTDKETYTICIPIIESIENLIGVSADDFRTDNELQTFVMNSTTAVMYNAFGDELCKNVTRCFYLKLMNIRGNTILDMNICSWNSSVYKGLLNKLADKEITNEMGAYMKQGFIWYLINGPTYTGYDNVTINDFTRVVFGFVTPSNSTTLDTTVGSRTTLDHTNVPLKTTSTEHILQKGFWANSIFKNTLILRIILLSIVYCFCSVYLMYWYYGWSKIRGGTRSEVRLREHMDQNQAKYDVVRNKQNVVIGSRNRVSTTENESNNLGSDSDIAIVARNSSSAPKMMQPKKHVSVQMGLWE
eukprot:331223_1